MIMLFCRKCDGRVLLDRALCKDGDIELFCIRCGKRWEIRRTDRLADFFNMLEKKRRYGFAGFDTKSLLSEFQAA